MTPFSTPEPVPVPIRVLLPGDQEVVAHLRFGRQVPDGWRYEVGLPAYRNGPGDSVEPAEYRVWVRAPEHVRPVDGVSYDAVPDRVPGAALAVQEALGPRRPSRCCRWSGRWTRLSCDSEP
ncbi:hypothetical protein ACWCPX_36725 [Streptomyces olivaceoviridis]